MYCQIQFLLQVTLRTKIMIIKLLIHSTWSGTWHPLGRVTGGTLYPGLMVTSGVIYHLLRLLSMPIDIRNICVLLAPACSGLTALASYLITSEMTTSPSAGLLAAVFMGITPGYISRSVAGSYDNEAIAIFLLVFTFYLWIKSVKNGSAMWGAFTALFYGYMVSAWGGYVFITNLLPLHAFVLICMGRYSPRLYVSYSTWFALGTLASMQIPFVGFLPIRSSEHMSALGMSIRSRFVEPRSDLYRRFWPPATGCLCWVYPPASAKQAVSDPSKSIDTRSVRCICRRTCSPNRLRRHCTLEWSLLFTLGYWLCKDPHPYNCVCIWASADGMAGFLFRSQPPHLALSSWSIHVLSATEGRARIRRYIRCTSELLRRCHGSPDVDSDTRGLHRRSSRLVKHPGHLSSRGSTEAEDWTQRSADRWYQQSNSISCPGFSPLDSEPRTWHSLLHLKGFYIWDNDFIPPAVRFALHLGNIERLFLTLSGAREPYAWWEPAYHRRLPRSLLLATSEHPWQCENHVVVGLWIPDWRNGRSTHISW